MLYITELYELFIEPLVTVGMKTDWIMWPVHRCDRCDSDNEKGILNSNADWKGD